MTTSTITPGSWPDWIAATFTSFAFVVAAVSYARSVKVRREAQARLVYSKMVEIRYHEAGREFEMLPNDARIGAIGGGVTIVMPSSQDEAARNLALVPVIQMTAQIHNGSNELIGPAQIQVVNVGRKATYDTFSVVVGTIEPGSDYIVDFLWPNTDHPGQPALGTTVIFRDASGSWWRRHLAEPIESVHNDPDNCQRTPTERAGAAANARAMGLEPSPEPIVPWRARWHRFWRKHRGKSPIP